MKDGWERWYSLGEVHECVWLKRGAEEVGRRQDAA